MGKIIVIFVSLLSCFVAFYLAISHDISDFCVVRAGQYNCKEWDFLYLSVFAISYLMFGALLGVLVKLIIFKCVDCALWR